MGSYKNWRNKMSFTIIFASKSRAIEDFSRINRAEGE